MLARSAAAVCARGLPTLPRAALPASSMLSNHSALPSACTLARAGVSHVATDSVMTVAATPDGRVHVKTPLPGVPGVTDLDLPASASVASLIEAVRATDTSARVVEMWDGSGATVAPTTPLAFLLSRRSTLVVDDLHLAATPSASSDSLGAALSALREAEGGDASTAYARLRTRLLTAAASRRSLPFTEYVDMVREVAADASSSDGESLPPGEALSLAEHWLGLLHVDGVALHFHASPDPALRRTVLLQAPAGEADMLQAALDVGSTADLSKLADLAATAAQLERRLSGLTALGGDIKARAERQATLGEWALGAGMVGQYAFFLSFIYVTSWDFAEPLLYFVGYGYGIAGVLYFLASQRDPVSGNLHTTLTAWRRRALHRGVGGGDLPPGTDGELETAQDLPAFEARVMGLAGSLSTTLKELQVLGQRVNRDPLAALAAAREELEGGGTPPSSER